LQAGANSLSKYPATRLFGKPQSIAFERAVAEAGRCFEGSLTRIPPGDWRDVLETIALDPEVKSMILNKVPDYLDVMEGTRKLVRRGGKGKNSVRKIISIAEE
jgi:hypothetical protein